MGVFDDKKFETLDWMSQITETIDSELNAVLARLPDELEFSADQVQEMVKNNRSLSVRELVRPMLRDENTNVQREFNRLSWEEESMITDCFEFRVNGPMEIDLRTGIMQGRLALIKTKATFDDDELKNLLGGECRQAMRTIRPDPDYLPRLNEIMDILGGASKEMMGNKSTKKKVSFIANRLNEIFSKNEWRIRSIELSNKVGAWIKDYIRDGNLAALTNLCKLKVMTHNNMPIYSIEEEK